MCEACASRLRLRLRFLRLGGGLFGRHLVGDLRLGGRLLDCLRGHRLLGNRLLCRRLIESRDAQFGAQISVAFAEGLIVREPVRRSTIFRVE